MMIPIRCFTCGKVIAQHWEEYKSRTDKGEDVGQVLTELGVERYCCRQMFIGNVDLMEAVNKFKA